jgi:thymidylate synthase (FAD)
MTFYVQAPIFVFREFMRHRIASYNEESGRLPRAAAGLLRSRAAAPAAAARQAGHYEFVEGTPEQLELVQAETRKVCEEAYASYQRMLEAASPARSPGSCCRSRSTRRCT